MPGFIHAAERTFGGETVIRNHGLLASALARPQATVFGKRADTRL
ncbi:hypothetical protein [Haloactinospora alba]|nr:hypothetical protein [Haloactinospora alba]